MASSISKSIRLFLLLFLLSGLQLTHAQSPAWVPGELLVKLKLSSLRKTAGTRDTKLGLASLDALNEARGIKRIEPLINKYTNTRITNNELAGIFKITFPSNQSLEEIIAAYQQDPNVEYAQPNYVHRVDFTPNDALFENQNALKIIQAEQGWDLQLASPDVIVGVIDTGIDYNHEDLIDALWINAGEDLNGNGRVDSSDFNGLDDDNNGFIDDIRGWDFTDAPTFPDGGDFQTPDNDPFDENGHGTAVAGIIGATGNNKKGIAGLAFGCQIMNLRAGTSLGFLEEDDVASAIVYAVDNGARVINMSFGDDVASPLLRDVIQYAVNQNCVLVASAGNSASDQIHFPSGFPETISVGASTESDNLAGFSNYGSSVDLVAPGVNILTTKLGNSYGDFSGTSASAPLVSALAALILSRTPELSPESVKGLLTSTTDDLGTAGWDKLFAAGRINAFKALKSPFFSIVRITAPELDQGFSSGFISVRGTAAGALLNEFSLELGVGETPENWSEVFRQTNRQIIDEEITALEINSLQDTLYTLRLILGNKDGTAVEDKVRFFVDRTPPVISNIKQTPMLDGDRHSFLIEFETDDLCDASIYFRPAGSSADFQEKKLRFRTTSHRLNFSQDFLAGQMEFFIQVSNGAGLTSIKNNDGRFFSADLSAVPVGGAPIENLASGFQSSFLLAKAADFDSDGLKEIVINEYDDNFNFTALKILEFDQGQFREVFASSEVFIPRDWGDSDGDGLPEILAGRGPSTFIFEAGAANDFPTQIVWSNTNDAWASRFADLDQDGLGELILRMDDIFTVWETDNDNSYVLVDSFPNPTAGSNFVGVPHSEIADFDGDGQLEIIFGDFDGDIYIYENRGNNSYQFTWSDRLPLIDTIDYLSTGDYDGDGIAEFVVGCHSDPSLNTESTFDSRHWLYRIYKKTGDDSFETVWQQAFFGFQSPADFDTGVSSGDVDNDGRDEILINIFPDFYIVDYDVGLSEYKVIWQTAPNRSNSTIVADFDNNGLNEFYFNTGEQVAGYQFLSNFGGPSTPLAFQARPLDLNLVELSWQQNGPVDSFQIYRGSDRNNLALFDQTQNQIFLDATVQTDTVYWYAVSAIDSSLLPVASLPAPALKVKPGSKPFLESASFLPPQQVQLVFSEPMDNSVTNQTNFEIVGIGTPGSAVSHKAGKEVILTSQVSLSPGNYTIMVYNLRDLDGTPIDTTRNSVSFTATARESAPYLVSAMLIQANQLSLEFNEPLDSNSASEPGNYLIEPNVKISRAELLIQKGTTVILTIAPDSPIGPFGVNYFITVRNVTSETGVPIRFGQGDTAALIFSSPDLANIFAYPNPYRSDSGQDFVTIAGLTSEAKVRIMTTSGRIIRTLEETDGNGGVTWDLKDESGSQVSSGVYIFYVVGEGEKATGKLAVVR